MALQTILRTGVVLIGVVGASPALTQTVTNPPRMVPNAQAVAAAPTGPVLRRKPRAAEAPPADTAPAAPLDRETPEDAALNRMINGICRGC